MKYDLSIITPIYNGEKYIDRCLESIKKNNINYEIIIINDGSTDNIIKKLKEIKEKNIKIINLKENHGVSYARNIGIKEINGDYFTFIDIDDHIEEKTYDRLFYIPKKNNLDICGCNYYEISNIKIKSKYTYKINTLNNKELIKETLNDNISMVIWDKIYKTKTYKNILFDEQLKINEDYLYTINCICKTNKAMFINEYFYNHFKNDQSLTSKYICKDIKQNNYVNYLDEKIINKLKKYNEYNYYISNNYLKNIHLYSICIDKNNRYKYLKKYINKNEIKKLLNYKLNKFTKIEITIYLISIRLHLLLFPLYNKIRSKIRRN